MLMDMQPYVVVVSGAYATISKSAIPHLPVRFVGLFFGTATITGVLFRYVIGILIAKQILSAFSSLLAFAIGHTSGVAGLEGWSWIFLLEGLATIVVVIIPCFAKFLTPEGRAFVVWKKKYDNSFGYTTPINQLLTVPPYVVTIVPADEDRH
ncbi:hypothetical protein DFH29DRAFT_1069196 [Suillus ampliporus]|nr:hypothetical protein DFH29DRAFT_1069196 [Suillus ampliporus]